MTDPYEQERKALTETPERLVSGDPRSEELAALLVAARAFAKKSGMDGFAIPDPFRPGHYLIYGEKQLIDCAVGDLEKTFQDEQARCQAEFSAHANLRGE